MDETTNGGLLSFVGHAQAMVACDFFISVTATFRIIYVFVAMEIDSRRILHFNTTDGAVASLSWRHDSKEIYFGGADVASMAVDMNGGPEHMPVPRELASILNLNIAPLSGTIASDGKRWRVSMAQKNGVQPFTVVLN